MATNTGTFRVRQDSKPNSVEFIGDVGISGQPKIFNPMGSFTATGVDIGAATLLIDMAAGLAAFGNASVRFSSQNKITKLLVDYQTTTAASNGNVTVSVRNTDGSAPAVTSVLAGTSSTVAIGATQPLFGTLTFTFNRPVPIGTQFTVAILGTVSGTRTWFLSPKAEAN